MPYIKNQYRSKINEIIAKLDNENSINNEGDLNYLITNICLCFTRRKGLSYSTINTVMGVLSCVAREYYRRLVSNYENKKIKENGDLEAFHQFPNI